MSSYAWHACIRTAEGYRSKSFPHPTASLPFQKVSFFMLRHNLLGETDGVRGRLKILSRIGNLSFDGCGSSDSWRSKIDK
jgi:hypothetical protein